MTRAIYLFFFAPKFEELFQMQFKRHWSFPKTVAPLTCVHRLLSRAALRWRQQTAPLPSQAHAPLPWQHRESVGSCVWQNGEEDGGERCQRRRDRCVNTSLSRAPPGSVPCEPRRRTAPRCPPNNGCVFVFCPAAALHVEARAPRELTCPS